MDNFWLSLKAKFLIGIIKYENNNNNNKIIIIIIKKMCIALNKILRFPPGASMIQNFSYFPLCLKLYSLFFIFFFFFENTRIYS
jgi:hypothetical protein